MEISGQINDTKDYSEQITPLLGRKGSSYSLEKLLKKLKSFVKGITIEPVIFCYIVAWTLQSTLTTNLLLDKVCLFHFEFDDDECANLTSDTAKEDQVQTVVNQYNMYLKLILNIPTVFFILFLGPWSDMNGRKLPMILPFVGSFLASLICMMNSYLWWLAPEHILISAVPRAITGGFITLMMVSYSYISDLSKNKSRTTRIALLDMMFIISPPLGMYLSSVLFTCIGYTGVYGVSLVIYFICTVYIIIFIEDTRGAFATIGADGSRRSSCIDVRETAFTCIKKDGQSYKIIIILMCNTCLMAVVFGCVSIDYLYTQKKFSWNYSQYINLGTTNLILTGVGTSVVLPFLSYCLRIDDLLLGVFGCFSKISGSILLAFAYKPWHLYAAAVVSIVGGIPHSVNRSKISKLAPPEGVGKVFSMLASWESVIPLISNPLYTFTYNATIDAFPGAIFFITCTVFAGAALIFIWVYILENRKTETYTAI